MGKTKVWFQKRKNCSAGVGPNRIGQGIEFDYCCVHGLLAIKDAGYEAIMVNCNPKPFLPTLTLQINYILSPFTGEHLEEILDHEKPEGVIVQLGGQTALKLAELIHKKAFASSVPHMMTWTLPKTGVGSAIC